MSNVGRMVYDCLLDRPTRVSCNVNGHISKDGKETFHAVVWINGYPFLGMEWKTQGEAQRDCDRMLDALEDWRSDAKQSRSKETEPSDGGDEAGHPQGRLQPRSTGGGEDSQGTGRSVERSDTERGNPNAPQADEGLPNSAREVPVAPRCRYEWNDVESGEAYRCGLAQHDKKTKHGKWERIR